MSSDQDDLDLLLSLQDRVLETPPGSPSNFNSNSLGFLSDDDESPRRRKQADLSVFRDAVQDCLHHHDPKPVVKAEKLKQSRKSNEAQVEKYSGLRIRNQLVTPEELSKHFSDIRFIRLPAIKNLLVGDTISGCWATVGVLTEKGNPRTSSVGKTYSIWKIGCLDENAISLFLFGDAYLQNSTEQAGTVFALFNCTVRKDNSGGFSLSVYSPNQVLKMGTSSDYGVCKGKRKDGMPCTLVINKRQGIYCRFHKSKASDIFSTTRAELKGGRNLRTAFRDPLKSRDIHIVDPLADRTNSKKSMQPVKLLSVEGLKKALSNADKVTTNTFSQGVRFLNEITGKMKPNLNKASAAPKQQMTNLDKRKSSKMKVDTTTVEKREPNAKRTKTNSVEKAKQGTGKMIELDIYASDEEL